MIFKLELSPQNFHYDILYPLYSAKNESKLWFKTDTIVDVDATQC